MKTSLLLLLLTFHCFKSLCFAQQPARASNLTVMGTVYCDTCSSRTFSKHSYFLEGAEVHVECRSREKSSKSRRILFSANATTNKYGVYAILLPSSEEFSCRKKQTKRIICRASLSRSSTSSCSHPGLRSSTKHMTIKSKQADMCFYSFKALSYRPPKKEFAICGAYKGGIPPNALNTSEFFWPFMPPFGFPFPFPFPPLPPWPSLPLSPLPPLPPLPHFPPLPFPFPPLPPFTGPPTSLPFTFPPLPPLFPPLPPAFSPPPPPPPPPSLFPPLPPLFPPLTPIFGPTPPPFWTPWFPFFPPSPSTASQNQNP